MPELIRSGASPPSPPAAAPAEMLLEIIADGGHELGYGHLGRCLALAEELGDRATFAVTGPSAEFVASRGSRVGPGAEAPVVLLDQRAPTPVETVRALQTGGRRVVLLDDLGPGREQADLLIDPPTAARWPPTSTRRLAGFDHVLLRAEVRRTVRSSDPRGVLVAMGGSDPSGATGPLASALDRAGIEVVVNIGPGARATLPASTARVPASKPFVEAVADARMVVASFGHTLIEAAHLGVPAIAVVLRADQREHAAAFCAQGTAELVDMSEGLQSERLVALVQEMLASPGWLEELSRRGRSLVDGRGVQRVLETIKGLA